MIPLYVPYYASTNATALSGALGREESLKVETDLQSFFSGQYGLKKVFFTKSCTHALETIALLLQLQPGDEVIVPSYTYVSTANAFALHGATIVFADSNVDHPNVDVQDVLQQVTPKTKAIVVMHYSGVAVEGLQELKKTCDEKGIFLIEDAAHCIHAFSDRTALGATGHAAVFSFHESKNIGCTEGGMLVVNHRPWIERTESLQNKGTNRALFERKETALYEWVDLGSAWRMDLLHMCLLRDQLQYAKTITRHRLKLYDFYLEALQPLRQKGLLDFYVPRPAQKHNAHIFWIRLRTGEEREALRKYLLEKKVYATFHYLALHKSPYGKRYANGHPLINAEKMEAELLRIPLYYPMSRQDAGKVVTAIERFFTGK